MRISSDQMAYGTDEQSGVFEFEIPGHSARREWAVYIIIATHPAKDTKFLYVGKVGDNRAGCNPIISRIGNHLSHNKIHSQIRNRIEKASDYNYKVLYSVFGTYSEQTHVDDRVKINEIERRLNQTVQFNLSLGYELMNPYKGIGISKRKTLERQKILTAVEIEKINKLALKAFTA